MSEPNQNTEAEENDKKYRELFGEKAQQHGTNSGAVDPLIGQRVTPDYQIIDRLGSGSMAIVYKARQLKSDRIVALKTLKERDPVVMERFYREVQTMAKLKHVNVVEAFDCIRTESGQTFLVMEYLDGQTMDHVLKTKGRVEKPGNFASVLTQICAAVEHAHQQRIIHRDLKPANILLVVGPDGKIVPKVLDFGIAKLQDDLQKLTTEGQALGSPMYMSPEQCMGHELTPASDVYSLGILGYQMITGNVPYRGAQVLDLMAAHCNPDVWPPPIDEVRPDLACAAQLNQIIFRALDTNLEKRFQTVAAFSKAITVWHQAVQKGEVDRPLPKEITAPAPPSQTKERVKALHELVESKREKVLPAKASDELDVTAKKMLLVKVCSFFILAIVLTSGLTFFLLNQEAGWLESRFVEASRFVSNLFPAPPKAVEQPVKVESDATPATNSDPAKSEGTPQIPKKVDSALPEPEAVPLRREGEFLDDEMLQAPQAVPRPNYYPQDQGGSEGGRRRL